MSGNVSTSGTVIDACGLSCPQPVLLFVNAVKQGGETFTVLVDNEASRENVSRAARHRGFAVDVQDAGKGVFRLCLHRKQD